MGNCFWIYKAGAKLLLFIFQPILKSSDLTGPCYNEQNLSVLSGFVKTRVHRIKRPLFHKIHRKTPVPLALFPIFYTASIFSYTRHTSTKVKEFLIFFWSYSSNILELLPGRLSTNEPGSIGYTQVDWSKEPHESGWAVSLVGLANCLRTSYPTDKIITNLEKRMVSRWNAH